MKTTELHKLKFTAIETEVPVPATHENSTRFRWDYQRVLGKRVRWMEYKFEPVIAQNGYVVTLAAIYTNDRHLVFGASVCSPDDVWDFDISRAHGNAIGRARQAAFRLKLGVELPEALTGDYTHVVWNGIARLESIANAALLEASQNAELVAVKSELKQLQKKHPTMNLDFEFVARVNDTPIPDNDLLLKGMKLLAKNWKLPY